MRTRFIFMFVIAAAAIILIPPGISLAMMDVDEVVHLDIEATAYCEGYYVNGEFTSDYAIRADTKPSYRSFVGEFWAGAVEPASTVPPSSYPFVALLVQFNDDINTRITEYYPYTYGDIFEWSESFVVEDGDKIRFQIQIYWKQSASTYTGDTVYVADTDDGWIVTGG